MNIEDATCEMVDSRHGIYALSVLVRNYSENLCDAVGKPLSADDMADLAGDEGMDAFDWIEPHIRDNDNGLIYCINWREGDLIAVHPDAEWSNYLACMFLPEDSDIRMTLPDWSLSYLVNGDASGLTDGEIKQIDRFCKAEPAIAAGTFTIVSEPYFAHSNDLDSPGSNVVDVIATAVES